MLLLAEGVIRADGDGCFNGACRIAFGVENGEGCLITGYVEVLLAGRGLIVTFTSGVGIERLKRNKERMAAMGTTVKSRMRMIPSRVIRK